MSRPIHWPVLSFIIGYHLLLLVGVPLYLMVRTPSLFLLSMSAALVFLSGLGITAGYHRLMAHGAYKTNRFVEAILLFFASIATQGSALRWCYDHRLHHAYVDTDRDPYSIKKGFLYAHILWMFYQSPPIDPKVVADLSRSPLVRFQHRWYGLCFVFTNALVFLGAGLLTGDWWGALVWAVLARMCTLHHLTWFINSLAHTWGSQSYSREHSAVDSYILCLLTFGEGYHNYHHTFPYDFRNGIRWYHFDPTKWLIWTLSKLRLAWGLRKVEDLHIFRQLLQDHRRELLKKLERPLHHQREFLEQKISELQEALVSRLTLLHQLLADRSQRKAEELRATKKALKEDWRLWKDLVRSIEKGIPWMVQSIL
jgi:stearoyl-CoA desaturase (Delta-9 desaturase)